MAAGKCSFPSLKYWFDFSHRILLLYILGPKLIFAERDKHYPSRSGQTSLATAVPNFTKPVTKNNFGPSILWVQTSRS